MDAEKKAVPLKWMKILFYILVVGGFLDRFIGANCFVIGALSDLGGRFYFISTFVFFIFIWLVLKKHNYTIETSNSTVQKLTPIMKFGVLFFSFLFGGLISLIAVNNVLDVSIWVTSLKQVEFKTEVSAAAPYHSSSRGGCNNMVYTFRNFPINTDTVICDRQDMLNGTKVGDAILVRENVGLIGARFLSAQRISGL